MRDSLLLQDKLFKEYFKKKKAFEEEKKIWKKQKESLEGEKIETL